MYRCQVFSPFCELSLHLVDGLLAVQKHFSFKKSHVSIVDLKSFPTPVSCRALSMFSSSSFSGSDFIFRSLIHLELFLCKVINTALV